MKQQLLFLQLHVHILILRLFSEGNTVHLTCDGYPGGRETQPSVFGLHYCGCYSDEVHPVYQTVEKVFVYATKKQFCVVGHSGFDAKCQFWYLYPLRGFYCVLAIINIVIVSTAVRKWFSTPWLSVCFPSGALNPLSAAAAAAAAAGRVALAGQTGSSGVLLVSNLNEEVSNTDTSNTSKMESLRLKLHRSYTPPPFICSCFFCCSLWVSFSISRFVFLSLTMCIKKLVFDTWIC